MAGAGAVRGGAPAPPRGARDPGERALYGTADRVGEVDLARETRDRVLSELDLDDAEARPPELFTLVEFLATPLHEELRDCDAALQILERYDLERRYAGTSANADGMLEAIRAACPR